MTCQNRHVVFYSLPAWPGLTHYPPLYHFCLFVHIPIPDPIPPHISCFWYLFCFMIPVPIPHSKPQTPNPKPRSIPLCTAFLLFYFCFQYCFQLLKTETSRGRTKTLQGNPKLSGTAEDDRRWQGSTRTQLKLWCFATRCSLVLNLDGWGFRRVWKVRMRRMGVQRGQSMSISDWGTYKKSSTYKYRKEHSRVKGNGHGFRHRSIETKIEQGDVIVWEPLLRYRFPHYYTMPTYAYLSYPLCKLF